MVTTIGNEGEWSHAVAQVVKPFDQEVEAFQIRDLSSDEWLVSNELLVTRVPSKEALHIDYRWKLPAVFAYVRTDYLDTSKHFDWIFLNNLYSEEGSRAIVPDTIFSVDANLTGNDEVYD